MKKLLLLLALIPVLAFAGNNYTILDTPSSTTPSGTAGGDLSGNYPNPTVAKIDGVTAGTAATINTGSSGNTLCLLSSACIWNALNTFTTTNSSVSTSSFVVNNTNTSSGQTTFDFDLAGVMADRLRLDYLGDFSFVAKSGAQYVWWIGGDFGVGTEIMTLSGVTLSLIAPGGTVNASNIQVSSVNLLPTLTGTTGSIGGSLLAAGACSTGTVTIVGVTTGMAIDTTPVTFPGTGFDWNNSYVSGSNTVTVQVCAIVAGTPTASIYNVRVLQ